jgi:hypothetical protein
MPVVTVNLLDTFDQWRLKTNDLGSNLGDLANLTTTDKTNIVAALNEVVSSDSDDMENVVDDVTPQLGGDLDLNSHNVTGTGNINTTGNLVVSGNVTTAQLSGTLAGTVTGVTQSPSDNTTKIATTAYVDAQVATENTVMEMDDTTISNPAENDILQWNATTNVWENQSLDGSGLLTDVVEDTSPQLGANLDLNSFQIEGTGNVIINGTIQANNIIGPVSGAVELVTDVSPQLGGGLDLNNNNVTGTGNINITGSITASSFSGTISSSTTGVTQSAGDNSTKLATTAYAQTAAANAAANVGSGLVFAIALG